MDVQGLSLPLFGTAPHADLGSHSSLIDPLTEFENAEIVALRAELLESKERHLRERNQWRKTNSELRLENDSLIANRNDINDELKRTKESSEKQREDFKKILLKQFNADKGEEASRSCSLLVW
jgi:hypothetical protein